MKLLKRSFFERSTLDVAPELLGKLINVKTKKGKSKTGVIVEVEAYTKDDPSCHAARGKTPRNQIMFGHGGFSYVYFIYGMYHCLNFVTEKKDVPGAVLIRAIETQAKEYRTGSGPGKLCKYLGITKKHNMLDCCDKDSLVIIANNNGYEENCSIIQTTRIGISQACDYPWRWYIKDNASVSKL